MRLAARGVVASLAALAAASSLAAPEAASAPASSAAIPYLADAPSSGDLGLRAGVALAVCALVGGIVFFVMIRGRKVVLGPVAGRHLDVVEARNLGAKGRLVVVRYDDLQLLLAQTDGGNVSLIHQKPASTQTRAPAEPPEVAS